MEKFSDWWTNYFWYHYKTAVIITLIAVFFVGSLIVSLVNYPSYDMIITVATDYDSADSFVSKLNSDFNDILADADGKKGINVNTYVVLTSNPDRQRQTDIGIAQSLHTSFYIDDSTIAMLCDRIVTSKKDSYWFEDLSSYVSKYRISEDLLVTNNSGEIVAIDISSFDFVKENGIKDTPFYLVLIKNVNQTDNEEYMIKRENAVKIFTNILDSQYR